jgi:hypothetical protein
VQRDKWFDCNLIKGMKGKVKKKHNGTSIILLQQRAKTSLYKEEKDMINDSML